MNSTVNIPIEHDAAIPTWFRVGGRAERFVRVLGAKELRACIEIDPGLRVLGDGANLLVDDDGVADLVVKLPKPDAATLATLFANAAAAGGDPVVVRLPAGTELPEAIVQSVRAGLGGLEVLGGIPASLGGAVAMNAGGAFGQIADVVHRVLAVDRAGRGIVLDRSQVAFDYRQSGLGELIITDVEVAFARGEPGALRSRLKDVMAYKKNTQPLAADSAGCVFKNATLASELPELASLGWTGPAHAGARVSAGFLIDRAGCKGRSVGGAVVSERHGNFIVTNPGATARDVIDLMGQVRRRVLDRFDVTLEPEVVVWSRRQAAAIWTT